MVSTPDDVDEQGLVEAARTDPARFIDLYDRYFHRLYAYALRRTRVRAEAEDITAEVFHRALSNIQRYEWRGVPFAAWLYRIAAHEIADRGRAAARLTADAPPDTSADPALERQVLLFELVDRLPNDQRRVIELRFGEGKTIQETAAEIGKSEGAVKQLQHRALERLRAAMEATRG